ncbi:MAG: hypothetical protein U9O06_03030 [Euryarchaeota archaeon]|nr:hypothetical protein [Euryarchaeota archaeon]
MDIPPPSVPESRLTDWRQTDQTVDSPFSTPVVSVHTHTRVYEESTEREQIREQTGVDHPWRFFFISRVRLDPPQPPNPMLTSLLRQRVASAFVDRLDGRGLTDITKQTRSRISVGDADGVQRRYHARLQLSADDLATELRVDDTDPDRLSLPIEALLVVWADGDYYVAGGAYPAGPPECGSDELVAALRAEIDPAAARRELVALIKGCDQQ